MSLAEPKRPSHSNDQGSVPSRPRRTSDPDDYRMTLGDHLEELRIRLVRALVGFVLAFLVCLALVKNHVLPFFCSPLLDVLRHYDFNTQLYSSELTDTFSIYLRVSAIAACVIAGPWMLWQLWQFVAAGLYPDERRTVTRYIPFSVLLFIAGTSFAFFVALPLTIQMLIYFTASVKLPEHFEPIATTQTVETFRIPILEGDPTELVDGQMWFNRDQERVKFALEGEARVLPFGPANLIAPLYRIPDYINLVMVLLLLFGVAFQLPLVVMALVTVGVFDVDELKQARRLAYFIILVASAVITPGDAITATFALVVPMIALYELGLLLSSRLLKDSKNHSGA
jgi:sec-independent protein translocase protein TatC